MKKLIFSLSILAMIVSACSSGGGDNTGEANVQTEAQAFIDKYTEEYQKLAYTASKAEWKSNTEILDGDSINDIATRAANEAYANFSGSVENIENAKKFLEQKDLLDPIQVKQLEGILYGAANNPQSVPDLVKARIKAETAQNKTLFGHKYVLDGDTVSTNHLDEVLRNESDVAKRLAAWECSKTVGPVLKDGLVSLRDMRNSVVQDLGYDNYFAYQVSDYGMSVEEMMDMMEQLNQELWPVYRELHTYARYELAEKYGEEVPDLLPAHWLPNRWGQDWSSMVKVEGLDLEGILAEKSKEWIVEQGERFYVSLGFPELPQSFWDKSDLYPLPEGAAYSKNNHASAWHLDLDKDVRSLMSVEPNPEWYETSHHELGHIYYYMTYTNPDVPVLLRGGANRGYHEAIGSLMGLAAMQKPFLAELDLLPEDAETDDMQILLKEALNYVVFIPFSTGVMAGFEHAIYNENIDASQFNAKWWELKGKYQGIAPPSERGEEYCDAASKTHINNDPAQYYDYAISYVLLFQFHDHIASKILDQDPHATNYYGSAEVGKFLQKVLYPGASRDWRELLKESTGSDMSAAAMVRYFEPLMEYLKSANEGREHTLPETMM